MKKIVILGCENSHANTFLEFIKNEEKYKDVEVVGVYSEDKEASEKLNKAYGVQVLENFDDAVGKIDGVMVTARHGDNHYKFAMPYIDSKIPMFIDKPVTISETEAVEFFKKLKVKGIKVSGGSTLRHADAVKLFKSEHLENKYGNTIGGVVRAPMDIGSIYGGFAFYAHHLVESVCEVFGRNPISVLAVKSGEVVTVLFRYDKYDVTGIFVEHDYFYSVTRLLSCKDDCKDGIKTAEIIVNENVFAREFDEFYDLLSGGEQQLSYNDFVAPVFITSAIMRSLESGKEEKVNSFDI